MTNNPKQTKGCIEVEYSPTTNFKYTTIKSSLLTDEEISLLWRIVGRIADDSSNPVNPSQDAEVFIGFIE
tara:strand:- start:211 stop:420 length:210 start_codon:yes stop_codon:yes gene_type:complete